MNLLPLKQPGSTAVSGRTGLWKARRCKPGFVLLSVVSIRGLRWQVEAVIGSSGPRLQGPRPPRPTPVVATDHEYRSCITLLIFHLLMIAFCLDLSLKQLFLLFVNWAFLRLKEQRLSAYLFVGIIRGQLPRAGNFIRVTAFILKGRLQL